MREHFSAFGTPLVPVEEMSLDERVRLLRAELGAWRYGNVSPAIGAYLASGIETFLRGDDDDLARVLGLRPPPGSRTAATTERLNARDAALARLAVAVGSSARAKRVIDGREACPKTARALVDELRGHVPKSKAAFCRAIARARRGHGTL